MDMEDYRVRILKKEIIDAKNSRNIDEFLTIN